MRLTSLREMPQSFDPLEPHSFDSLEVYLELQNSLRDSVMEAFCVCGGRGVRPRLVVFLCLEASMS